MKTYHEGKEQTAPIYMTQFSAIDEQVAINRGTEGIPAVYLWWSV
jgi:hypothetical protein